MALTRIARLFSPARDGTGALAAPATRLSQRFGYRPQNSRYASAPATRQTIASLLHLEAAPCWVRLLYVNDQPEPWTVDAAAVAPTAAEGDGVMPVDADGRPAPALFSPMTFACGGADAPLDLDPDDAPPSLTVPGNVRDPNRPVQAWSDWRPVTALPRQDGGAGSLLLVRTYAGGRMRFAASVGGPDPAIGRLHAGFVADGTVQAGPRSPSFATIGYLPATACSSSPPHPAPRSWGSGTASSIPPAPPGR